MVLKDCEWEVRANRGQTMSLMNVCAQLSRLWEEDLYTNRNQDLTCSNNEESHSCKGKKKNTSVS